MEEEKKEESSEEESDTAGIETFQTPEETTSTESSPTKETEEGEGESERKCILCGADMKMEIGFMCNACRDRLRGKAMFKPEEGEDEKVRTVKF